MGRGPAAAQVVVVHGGQIVVDQRVAVHHLERRAGPQRTLALDAEQPRGLDHQEGPQPLAAAERRIAHGLEQARRPRDFARQGRGRQQPVERRLDRVGNRLEPVVETRPHKVVGIVSSSGPVERRSSSAGLWPLAAPGSSAEPQGQARGSSTTGPGRYRRNSSCAFPTARRSIGAEAVGGLEARLAGLLDHAERPVGQPVSVPQGGQRRLGEAAAVRRVEEREPEGRDGRGTELRRVAPEHPAGAADAERLDVVADQRARFDAGFDEQHERGAARQAFEPQRAGAGEEVDDARRPARDRRSAAPGC